MALVYGLGVDLPIEGRFENWPPGTRFLTMDDLPRIVEIVYKITNEWRPDYWQQKMQSYIEHRQGALGVEADGCLVGVIFGYVGAREYGLKERVGWVENMGVDPAYQRQGYGRKLMDALLEYFRQAGIREVYTLVKRSDRNMLGYFTAMNFTPGDLASLERKL